MSKNTNETILVNKKSRLRQILALFIVAVVGIAVNLSLYTAIRNIENEQFIDHFDFAARKRIIAIERSIENQALTMVALQNHLKYVHSREAFLEFTQPFLNRVIGIQALSWAPRVQSSERNKYVADATQDGLTNFDFLVRNNQSELVTAPQKSEYYPVYYIEPVEGNRAALGFDLSSNEARLNTINDTIRSGSFAVTRRIALIQGDVEQSGFLMFLPIFSENPASLTELERIEQIEGIASGVFIVGDLIDQSISYLSDSEIDLYVSDVTDPNNVENLHYFTSLGEQTELNQAYYTQVNDRLHESFLVSVGNRTWKINMVATDAYIGQTKTSYASVLLVIGLFATLLITSYMNIILSRTLTINNLVETRTRELKQSKLEAEKAKEVAEIANQSKTDFLSNVSHELRTPLNGILGLSSTILKYQNDNLNEKQFKGLNMIHRSGMRLLDLINDLLDLAKVESGNMTYSERPVRLSGIIDFSENLFKGLMEGRVAKNEEPLDFRIESIGYTPEFIITDRKRLEQIFVNILGNAVKFTSAGKVTIEIKVIENSLWFEISDTGIGINPEKLESIFEKFQQIDGSTSRTYQGTGLGLSLTKALVELIRGEIHVESVPRKGTTMKIGLPLKGMGLKMEVDPFEKVTLKDKYYPFRVEEENKDNPITLLNKAIQDKQSTQKQNVLSPQTLKSASIDIQNLSTDAFEIINNKNFLVCSGNSDVNKHVSKILENFTVKMKSVENATSAFEALQGFEPDVLIIEPSLPDMKAHKLVELAESLYPERKMAYVLIGENNTKIYNSENYTIDLSVKALHTVPLLNAITRVIENKISSFQNREKALILIADDEEVGQELLKMILETKYELCFASNGEEAVQLYFEMKPDLVLMDIMMPKLDGIKALERIAMKDPTHAPIIALTAKAMLDDEQTLLESGFNSYISKPFKSKNLLQVVDTILSKSDEKRG